MIDAGAGNDVVVTADAKAREISVDLGSGFDHFGGGASREIVTADTRFDGSSQPAERDIIRTAGGDDNVVAGRGDSAVEDAVLLGPGRDRLTLRATTDSGARVRGGPGTDLLVLDVEGVFGGDPAEINTQEGTVRTRETTLVSISNVEHFFVGGDMRAVKFFGSAAHESLRVTVPSVLAHFGDGNDRLEVNCNGSVRATGGSGNDRLLATKTCANTPMSFSGGTGNDVLRGSKANDVLLGGAGFDRAEGAGGRDRCAAEVRSGCER